MSSPNPPRRELAGDSTTTADAARQRHESNQPHRGITLPWRLRSASQIRISSQLTMSVVVPIGS